LTKLQNGVLFILDIICCYNFIIRFYNVREYMMKRRLDLIISHEQLLK
jgi:hypothetical protein